MTPLSLIFVLLSLLVASSGFQTSLLGRSRRMSMPPLNQRVAKNEKGEERQFGKLDDDGEGDMEVPYQGLAGNSEGRVFNTAIPTFDPMDGTDDLPGEDGSDAKISAIQSRIQERVAELKKTGEWGEEGDEYGIDPLRTQNLFVTMAQQAKACKPFDSFGDLSLTYLLVLTTTVFLSTYLISLREALDSFIGWYEQSDFDALTSVLNGFRG